MMCWFEGLTWLSKAVIAAREGKLPGMTHTKAYLHPAFVKFTIGVLSL